MKSLTPTALMLTIFLAFSSAYAQTNANSGKNNPYSPSPSGKVLETKQTQNPSPTPTTVRSVPGEVAFIMQRNQSGNREETHPNIAQQNYKPVKAAEPKPLKPTEIYKIGIGDVLFVNLKNSPAGSGYYAVRTNGTIDYPLAGENVNAVDQTVAAIEDTLKKGITLFPDPQVEVKVREYASHKVAVSGMVDNPGEKSLQREAIPMFVIRAEAVVSAKATKAVVTRAPLLKPEIYDLADASTENVLIYPGNSIEFTAPEAVNAGFYIISGEIASGGQKNLTQGMTLYQAFVAAGGAKGNPKKAIIRRKNNDGVLSGLELNLRAIKDGKASDPALFQGDVIEIRN